MLNQNTELNKNWESEGDTEQKDKLPYLDEWSVLKDLVGVTDKFELLHYGHRPIQVKNHSSGCNSEIILQKENRNLKTKFKKTDTLLLVSIQWVLWPEKLTCSGLCTQPSHLSKNKIDS